MIYKCQYGSCESFQISLFSWQLNLLHGIESLSFWCSIITYFSKISDMQHDALRASNKNMHVSVPVCVPLVSVEMQWAPARLWRASCHLESPSEWGERQGRREGGREGEERGRGRGRRERWREDEIEEEEGDMLDHRFYQPHHIYNFHIPTHHHTLTLTTITTPHLHTLIATHLFWCVWEVAEYLAAVGGGVSDGVSPQEELLQAGQGGQMVHLGYLEWNTVGGHLPKQAGTKGCLR